MKNKTWLIILLIIAALGILAYFLRKKIIPTQERKIAKLEQQINFLKNEIVPIRYKILEKKGDSIYIAIKFMDLDGNLVNKTRMTLYGDVISFDFIVVKLGERYVAFPQKIFTNKIKPENGLTIYSLYDKDGYPMIYYSKNANKDFKEGIKILFQKVKNNDLKDLPTAFGNMVQNVKNSAWANIGDVFRIVVHTKGGIEIIKE